MYGDQFGEFVCGYWGLKGLKIADSLTLVKTSIAHLLCFVAFGIV